MNSLVPATLAFDVNGAPFSLVYHDIYHSTHLSDGGVGQAQHVFLAGNGLLGNEHARWNDKETFVIVETGFGLGLNFLATWDAWRKNARHCERLHFISIEKHPFTREALTTLHARYAHDAAFASLTKELQNAYPVLMPGLHRLEFANEFEDGRVVLTLAFGDVADVLPKLHCIADAIYLDGFAPEKNPEMWTPANMKALARLAKADTTFATYTAARSVRDALENAGFVYEKRKGYGRKRDMLVGKYQPRYEQKRRLAASRHFTTTQNEKRALVIGAGLAGAAVAERLSARGWQIEMLERNAMPALETSGLHAGIFHPHVSPDDALLSRLTRAGFLYALEQWKNLLNIGSGDAAARRASQANSPRAHATCGARCGVLQIAKDDAQETLFAKSADALQMPADYAAYVSRDVASKNAGIEVARGGWWFPHGGWVRARELVTAQIQNAGLISDITLRLNTNVDALKYDGTHWQAFDANNKVIASAPVVILANAHDAARLINIGAPMQSIRGQISLLDANTMPTLKTVVCGDGYVLPPIGNVIVAGATYDFDDENVARDEDDANNLAQVKQLLPTLSFNAGLRIGNQVGFRCVARDRMPLVGNLPDVEAARAMQTELSGAHLPDLPRLPRMYGAFGYASRGMTWSALAGEVLASEINGEPAPMENDLLNAIDPGRFVLQQVRRGTL